jgi:hypothetical protein
MPQFHCLPPSPSIEACLRCPAGTLRRCLSAVYELQQELRPRVTATSYVRQCGERDLRFEQGHVLALVEVAAEPPPTGPLEGVLRVRKSKTEAGERSIALSPMLRDVLSERYRATSHRGDDELVFCHPHRGTIYRPVVFEPQNAESDTADRL